MTAPVRVPVSALSAGPRDLEREVAHYLIVVHRLEAGDGFVAFDPESATEADAVLTRADPRRARCELREPRAAKVAATSSVTLVQALVKGEKPEQVVRSATALGVVRIVFVQAERSVVRPSDGPRRLERLKAVALDAARQCGRGDVPELAGPTSPDELLAHWRDRRAYKLCLQPEADFSLLQALESYHASAEVVLFVGPEGGWSEAELRSADEAGFTRVRLGPLSLRTELAGIAALGALVCLADGSRPAAQNRLS